MSKYLTGKTLRETYQLEKFELFEMVVCGELRPCDKFGNDVPDPIIEITDILIEEWTAKVRTTAQACDDVHGILSLTAAASSMEPPHPLLDKPRWLLKLRLQRKVLKRFKMFRSEYMHGKNKPGNTATLKSITDPEEWEPAVLKQFDILEKALFLKSEVDRFFSRTEPEEKTRPSPTKQVYKALAAQAVLDLKDAAYNGVLPLTRKEKLAYLKGGNTKFSALFDSIGVSVTNTYLMRKLGEAQPGIWEIGEHDKPKQEINQKFRKKSTLLVQNPVNKTS